MSAAGPYSGLVWEQRMADGSALVLADSFVHYYTDGESSKVLYVSEEMQPY